MVEAGQVCGALGVRVQVQRGEGGRAAHLAKVDGDDHIQQRLIHTAMASCNLGTGRHPTHVVREKPKPKTKNKSKKTKNKSSAQGSGARHDGEVETCSGFAMVIEHGGGKHGGSGQAWRASARAVGRARAVQVQRGEGGGGAHRCEGWTLHAFDTKNPAPPHCTS